MLAGMPAGVADFVMAMDRHGWATLTRSRRYCNNERAAHQQQLRPHARRHEIGSACASRTMIWMTGEDRRGAIELFGDDQSHEHVREGQRAE